MPNEGIPTTYKNIVFRSRLEAKWACFFDRMRWSWEYEPFDCNGWIPDFAIKTGLKEPHEMVLVEVKPITAFAPDVANKIDDAEMVHDVVLVGLGPFHEVIGDPRSNLCLGWLREVGVWQNGTAGVWARAIMGRWLGDESDAKNRQNVIGFGHEYQSYRDRITGCYDGGRFGRGVFDPDEVAEAWAVAQNATQWKPKPRFWGGVG